MGEPSTIGHPNKDCVAFFTHVIFLCKVSTAVEGTVLLMLSIGAEFYFLSGICTSATLQAVLKDVNTTCSPG